MRLLQELRWRREQKNYDKRIGTALASVIVARRNKLYAEYLELEKRKGDLKEHKIRLEELDWIIRGCK